MFSLAHLLTVSKGSGENTHAEAQKRGAGRRL